MTDGGLDAGGERLGDDGAMALGGIAFVAQQHHSAAEFLGERIQKCALRGQVLSEISEVASIVAVDAQLMSNLFRRSKRAFVTIADAGSGKRFAQRSLGESLTTRQSDLPDIQE